MSTGNLGRRTHSRDSVLPGGVIPLVELLELELRLL